MMQRVPDNDEEVERACFRLVSASDDPKSLSDLIGRAPMTWWAAWRNRAGHSLLEVCEERRRDKCAHYLRTIIDEEETHSSDDDYDGQAFQLLFKGLHYHSIDRHNFLRDLLTQFYLKGLREHLVDELKVRLKESNIEQGVLAIITGSNEATQELASKMAGDQVVTISRVEAPLRNKARTSAARRVATRLPASVASGAVGESASPPGSPPMQSMGHRKVHGFVSGASSMVPTHENARGTGVAGPSSATTAWRRPLDPTLQPAAVKSGAQLRAEVLAAGATSSEVTRCRNRAELEALLAACQKRATPSGRGRGRGGAAKAAAKPGAARPGAKLPARG